MQFLDGHLFLLLFPSVSLQKVPLIPSNPRQIRLLRKLTADDSDSSFDQGGDSDTFDDGGGGVGGIRARKKVQQLTRRAAGTKLLQSKSTMDILDPIKEYDGGAQRLGRVSKANVSGSQRSGAAGRGGNNNDESSDNESGGEHGSRMGRHSRQASKSGTKSAPAQLNRSASQPKATRVGGTGAGGASKTNRKGPLDSRGNVITLDGLENVNKKLPPLKPQVRMQSKSKLQQADRLYDEDGVINHTIPYNNVNLSAAGAQVAQIALQRAYKQQSDPLWAATAQQQQLLQEQKIEQQRQLQEQVEQMQAQQYAAQQLALQQQQQLVQQQILQQQQQFRSPSKQSAANTAALFQPSDAPDAEAQEVVEDTHARSAKGNSSRQGTADSTVDGSDEDDDSMDEREKIAAAARRKRQKEADMVDEMIKKFENSVNNNSGGGRESSSKKEKKGPSAPQGGSSQGSHNMYGDSNPMFSPSAQFPLQYPPQQVAYNVNNGYNFGQNQNAPPLNSGAVPLGANYPYPATGPGPGPGGGGMLLPMQFGYQQGLLPNGVSVPVPANSNMANSSFAPSSMGYSPMGSLSSSIMNSSSIGTSGTISTATAAGFPNSYVPPGNIAQQQNQSTPIYQMMMPNMNPPPMNVSNSSAPVSSISGTGGYTVPNQSSLASMDQNGRSSPSKSVRLDSSAHFDGTDSVASDRSHNSSAGSSTGNVNGAGSSANNVLASPSKNKKKSKYDAMTRNLASIASGSKAFPIESLKEEDEEEEEEEDAEENKGNASKHDNAEFKPAQLGDVDPRDLVSDSDSDGSGEVNEHDQEGGGGASYGAGARETSGAGREEVMDINTALERLQKFQATAAAAAHSSHGGAGSGKLSKAGAELEGNRMSYAKPSGGANLVKHARSLSGHLNTAEAHLAQYRELAGLL
jgi:hypothetical protein